MLRNNGRHNYRSPYGIQPTLNLPFATTRTLDSRITFTRSSTATYTNSSGVLTSAAINEPRFGYDPVTLLSLGLYVEEPRTNILLNSLLNGTNLSTQTVTTTATAYTLSFYGTGTIALTGTNISTQTGTGAYPSRKTFTFTPTAGSLILTVTGTVQYAQLEVGSFASSFIPTAGSQVTRASDNPAITGTDFSNFYNPLQGTLFVDVKNANSANGVGGWSVPACIEDSNTNYSNTTLLRGSQAIAVVANNVATNWANRNLNPTYKVAIALAPGNFIYAYNGTLDALKTSPTTMPLNQIQLGIGFIKNATNSYLNGFISQLTYYSVALPDKLQSLTT